MVNIEYSEDGKAKIPFRSGNLLSCPDWYGGSPIEWRDNYAFDAALTFVEFYRRRSAAGVIWKDSDGQKYPMFLADLGLILRQGVGVGGVVQTSWTFVKRGANYGITPSDAPKPRRMIKRLYARGSSDVNDLSKLRFAGWKGTVLREVDYETEHAWAIEHFRADTYLTKDYPPRYITVYGPWDGHRFANNKRFFEVAWRRKGEVRDWLTSSIDNGS